MVHAARYYLQWCTPPAIIYSGARRPLLCTMVHAARYYLQWRTPPAIIYNADGYHHCDGMKPEVYWIHAMNDYKPTAQHSIDRITKNSCVSDY
jgi:hypothetical protein